jgi:hypothetical protein
MPARTALCNPRGTAGSAAGRAGGLGRATRRRRGRWPQPRVVRGSEGPQLRGGTAPTTFALTGTGLITRSPGATPPARPVTSPIRPGFSPAPTSRNVKHKSPLARGGAFKDVQRDSRNRRGDHPGAGRATCAGSRDASRETFELPRLRGPAAMLHDLARRLPKADRPVGIGSGKVSWKCCPPWVALRRHNPLTLPPESRGRRARPFREPPHARGPTRHRP